MHGACMSRRARYRFDAAARFTAPAWELAAVAQPRGYPIDGQMDCLHHALVGLAGAMTLQQFDLYMVERIEVGEAVLDRARQQGILLVHCHSARSRGKTASRSSVSSTSSA